ncbi:MAG: Teichoic acid export ATP-binding protein TagH [Candidatus Saccharibacteria bacterium]|nr:Teichoic acid export ATP-binding protein TagH [Candidatus Saccharibacteria bacterium]
MTKQTPMITVENLDKAFKLPHEQHSGLKQAMLSIFKKRNKGYDVQKVLNGITFDIKEGEFFGIVGRNGSGKSTLLKLLAGIYEPDRGFVQVNGSLTPFIELGVGFNPELTGRENVFMNGALLGFDRKQMNAMYHDIVSFAELEKFMDQKLKNYSSGMQVRLAFSIAIRARSDILILDEVLAVGDSAFQQKCFDYFKQLREENKTIVLVTHDMSAVKRFCTSAIYLKKGKIVASGAPSDIADMYLVDNMESLRQSESNKSGVKQEAIYGLRMETLKESDEHLEVKFFYEAKSDDEMYIATSILQNGTSVAEITTPTSRALKGKGSVIYTIDKTMFNPGVYELTAVLSAIAERKLLTIGANKINFVVKGNDLMRGAALKLPDNWAA